jgi:hypothetical protein
MSAEKSQILLPGEQALVKRFSRRVFGKNLAIAGGATLFEEFVYPLSISSIEHYSHPDSNAQFRRKYIDSSQELDRDELRQIFGSVKELHNVSYAIRSPSEEGALYEGVITSNGTQFVCGEITGVFDELYSMPIVDVACHSKVFRSALIQSPESNRVKFHIGKLPAGEFPFSVKLATPLSSDIKENPVIHFFDLAASHPALKTLIKLFPQDGVKMYTPENFFLGSREDMLLAMFLGIRKAEEKYFALIYGINGKELHGDPHSLWDMSGRDSFNGPRTTDIDVKQMATLLVDGTLLELSHMEDTALQFHDIPVDAVFDVAHPFHEDIDISLQEKGEHGMVERGAKTDIVTSYIPFFYDYDWKGNDWDIAVQVISLRQLLARGQMKADDLRIKWFISAYLGGKDLITPKEFWSR